MWITQTNNENAKHEQLTLTKKKKKTADILLPTYAKKMWQNRDVQSQASYVLKVNNKDWTVTDADKTERT